ncbi:MAG: ribonuclease H-like domain-containing protein [Lachnospiraceae bacterium]
MIKITNKAKIYDNTFPVSDRFLNAKTLFFDIETTGFSAKNTSVYMIGAAFLDQSGDFLITQWLCDEPANEALIIADFFEFMSGFHTVIHFNGEGFDMPYLEAKCKAYNLPYNFGSVTSVDLLKIIRSFGKFLKLENLKQKTIERFLGICREDSYSGGELINVYHNYSKTHNTAMKELLLLHNYDDLCGLLSLTVMVNYQAIISSDFEVQSIELVEKGDSPDAIFIAELPCNLPKRISYGNNTYYFTAFNNMLKVKIPVYTSELKYFFPNYRDYYYLPVEDTAIHKSVAFYVDKNYRTRAKAANCYSKKTGTFLPQEETLIEPYFKIDYYDKNSYFELDCEFREDKEKQKKYLSGIIKWLL